MYRKRTLLIILPSNSIYLINSILIQVLKIRKRDCGDALSILRKYYPCKPDGLYIKELIHKFYTSGDLSKYF